MIQVTIKMTTAPCSAHKAHSTSAAAYDGHHVIPQAWQAVWSPEGKGAAVSPDFDHPDPKAVAVTLWDPRTVPLCPTGHRNVHYWLVRLMKAIDLETLREAGIVRALADARTTVIGEAYGGGIRPGASEMGTACQAIIRTAAAAASPVAGREAIEYLISRKQWGEA